MKTSTVLVPTLPINLQLLLNFPIFCQVLHEAEPQTQVLHLGQEEDCPLHDHRLAQAGQRRLSHLSLRRHLPGQDAGRSL